ncbi:MAG: methyltransferase domain-containing protein, partial [Rhodopila sp.]
TLGPVSDLERHLPTDWWRTLFNATYLQTDGDVVENEANTRLEVDLLLAVANVEPTYRILDLCCGQGRHSLELARRGFERVTGTDRSRYLIRLARRRAKDANLPVVFREGDARSFRCAPEAFDRVCMMGNSFGYFETQADDLAVLRGVRRALSPIGVLVLDIVDGEWMRENFAPRSWEWIDRDHFACRERELSRDGERIISREVVVHAEKGVIADQFYAERLYSPNGIADLLRQAGFAAVELHGNIQALSDRNQDLGMMANRLFATGHVAAARPQHHPILTKRPTTVLLGDPRRPDMVKRNAQYNSEDLDTVRNLKQALGTLSAYEFTYLDEHDGLLATLSRTQPEMVFNLCDEGFNNDAYQEPHVPALLDMLRIPYTGAGPACLALCYDKAVVRATATAHGIAVPQEIYLGPRDRVDERGPRFPAFLKPAHGDNSLGITRESLVHTTEELAATVGALRRQMPGRPLLVQEFLPGSEYTVGIIGNPGAKWTVLPILEVDYSGLNGLPPILGHESKWHPDSQYWHGIGYRAATLDREAALRLEDTCGLLFERLGCRDYARFDFRTDAQGDIKLLEVNPNPGWCHDGKLNLMAGLAGLSYSAMLAMILAAARERLGQR